VSLVAQGIQRALGRTEPKPLPPSAEFDPTYSAADIDLARLSERLSSSADISWSLLLSGPPGTGKSAYARYLAKRCGIEVLERRASDLLDMYVGGTEKAIAAAFQESAETGAMLIVDEVDSMLRSRETARHSWEATMVNEMLTWMERHPAPFVATTNFSDVLDPATARRFLFKVRFEHLDLERRRRLFHHYFGVLPPQGVDACEGLSPADFAVVARRAKLLDIAAPSELVRMLVEEVESKSDYKNQGIGFAVSGKADHRVTTVDQPCFGEAA
jgi:SpoVK/Ycf46/Vps4 family AAA+-type ATPase